MADIVDSDTRSRMMAGIRGRDTKPEMIVRRGLHRAGFRARLHPRSIPGKPDLVFRKYGALVLVNGCFWHGHDCPLFKWPGGPRADFWRAKIRANIWRDQQNLDTYLASGWRVAIVWECALKGRARLEQLQVIDGLAGWLRGHDSALTISHEGVTALATSHSLKGALRTSDR